MIDYNDIQGQTRHLYAFAAAYCSKAEHCVSEVTAKLKKHDASEEQINRVLELLVLENFINEERYCRSFINDKYKYNRWGIIKISYALKAKKIPESIIFTSIDETIDREIYMENLLKMVNEKIRTTKCASRSELKLKVYRSAAARGFECDDIKKAISEAGL